MSEYFLQTVLPTTGQYCCVAIKDGAVRQKFFSTIEQLAEAAADLNASQIDAYFALANFATKRRKVDAAVSMRSFFIDIDCGPNKPYADPAAAAVALKGFIDATKLPSPIVVHSGGGLHAYWPFTEEVPVAKWLPMAKQLKALCVQHALAIDLTITADAARILRVPGTSNYKTGTARPVQIAADGQPTPFDTLCALLPPPPVDLSAAKSFGKDSVTSSLARGEMPPSLFARVLPKCAQMQHAVEHRASLPEPLWRGALSIAANCEDSEDAITLVSIDHPDYTPEKAREKAQRVISMPHTCEWYRTNNPDGCKGCKQKVTSPIVLGAVIEAAPTVNGAYIIEAELSPEDGEAVSVTVEVPEYPFPYFRGANGGVFRKIRTDDGDETEIEVYPQDLYVTSRFYDSDEHGDGEGELVGLNLHLPHDGVRRFHAPVTALLTKDKLLAVLAKHGVIAYGKQLENLMAYIASSIRSLQAGRASSRTRSQMGWTSEGSFVVGEVEYTLAGPKLAPPASGTRQLAPHFHSSGSLQEWCKIISFYNRPGMEGHAFGFLMGCGAPLLQLLNPAQVRGGMLNLVSNASGTGKTTVQMAINSLFGHPVETMMVQKDTKASMFQRMGTLNSICMTIDEMTNTPADVLSDLVYGATSGRAAHRMEASTNRLRSNQTTWCTVVVTSSNAVMSDILLSNKSAADGELRRVIDLHMKVPEGYSKAEAEEVFAPLTSNYGVAGPKYIEYVINNREAVIEMLKKAQARVDAAMNAERADRFYSAMVTVAMGAGMIFNTLEMSNFDLGRIFRCAIAEVKGAKDTNRAAVGTNTAAAHETLAAFLNENLNNVLIINSTKANGEMTAPSKSPHGPLRIRFEPDTGELVIVAAELRKFFSARRVDFKGSLAVFQQEGVLKTFHGELSAVRRPSAGAIGALKGSPTRCYVFDGTKLGMQGVLDEPDAPDAV